MAKAKRARSLSDKSKAAEKPCCGLVMPISETDNCSEQHWKEVKAILSEAIEGAGFVANLVSDADDVGVIQARIVRNLYENPIVVCDVSGLNPNVMFELGMRLAFDKPAIVVKDDKTRYSFDTSVIEHLPYPRDLRFPSIVEFARVLAEKAKATHEKATHQKGHTTFLKHFGTFTVAKVETTELPKEDFILAELKELRLVIERRESPVRGGDISRQYGYRRRTTMPLFDEYDMEREAAASQEAVGRVIRDEIARISIMEGGVGLPEMQDAIIKRVLDHVKRSSPGFSKDYLKHRIRTILHEYCQSEDL